MYPYESREGDIAEQARQYNGMVMGRKQVWFQLTWTPKTASALWWNIKSRIAHIGLQVRRQASLTIS